MQAIKDFEGDVRLKSVGKAPQTDSGGASATRAGALFWKIWLPIPIIFLLLDCTFNLFFWKIPKVTGVYADYGYQFLLGVHRLYEPKPEGMVRVLAFGSSVTRSFDPYQVQGLIAAADPPANVEIHRISVPGMKPSDYHLFFAAELPKVRPDVVVILFNLVDFIDPNFHRDIKPHIRYLLPPWTTLRERHAYISTASSKLDLALAGVSNVYRYRRLIRSCLRDHVRVAAQWLRSSSPRGGYGCYSDGYTKQRFGVPVEHASAFDLEYYIDPAWIGQRGSVTLNFSMRGAALAERVEVESGWKTARLNLPAGSKGILDVAADSAWCPRAAGRNNDVRLLGLKLRQSPSQGASDGKLPPFRYPPVEQNEIPDFLRMGDATGEEFAQKWQEALQSDTSFGHYTRLYQQRTAAVWDRPFQATGEYAEIAALVKEFSQHGVAVMLVNTPESPWLVKDYESSPYNHGQVEFFRDLASKYPHVQFHDLRNSFPPEDFNDWHHLSYIGWIKLGPVFADLLQQMIHELGAPSPHGS
ncbi:MAG: hypothetical protein ACHQ9S_13275 [Candidatus Binatia bacterium]